jgi:dTDP-4-amino-4,6-dideoxygalactose transaminase
VSVFNPVFPRGPFTPFQAGIARRMLARLPNITAARRRQAARHLAELAGVGGISIPRPVAGSEPVYLRLPVVQTGTLPLREASRLGVVRSYPSSLAAIPSLGSCLVPGVAQFPGADLLAERLLTVSTHQYVTDRDVARIAAFFRKEP